MNAPKWISLVFLLTAIYDGALGGLFLIAPELPYKQFEVTPPNHLAYVQFPAALLLIFAVMFVQIARKPLKYRSQMVYGILLKLAFVGVASCYWIREGIPQMWKPCVVIDSVTLLAFVVAYLSTGGRSATAK